MARTPIRVAVVNDYDVVTAGVAALLAPYSHRVTVTVATHAPPLRTDVDVLLYDTFGTVDGRDRVEELRAHVAKVIAFSWANTPQQIDAALEAGAASFLSKTASAEEIVEAIEGVVEGTPRIDTELTQGRMPMVDWPGRGAGLSAREAEVIALVARGLSNQQISDETYLSLNTVKTYIRTAYRKMGVSSRTQAVIWALDHGLGHEHDRADTHTHAHTHTQPLVR